jgi:hypothetical protein
VGAEVWISGPLVFSPNTNKPQKQYTFAAIFNCDPSLTVQQGALGLVLTETQFNRSTNFIFPHGEKTPHC